MRAGIFCSWPVNSFPSSLSMISFGSLMHGWNDISCSGIAGSNYGHYIEHKLRRPFLVICTNRCWLTFFFCMNSLLTFCFFLFWSSKAYTSFCNSCKVSSKCKIISKTTRTIETWSQKQKKWEVIRYLKNDFTNRKQMMRLNPKMNHQEKRNEWTCDDNN